MGAHVALLRGVNVGGANKLAMSELKAVFENAGCSGVRTVIQSGNVVFWAPSGLIDRLAHDVVGRLRRHLGIETSIILRSRIALLAIIADNPFLHAGADPAHLHVMCLAERPAAQLVATLDPLRSRPDEFEVHGSDIYLRFPNGVARSKYTNAYFDRMLRTVGTARNWRTMLQLRETIAEMTDAPTADRRV
jgi:uncharacterized protein (DUF1697 family)